MQQPLFLLLLLSYILCTCKSDDNPSIVIIGAGAAGIAAASRLIKSGLTNIKILEAENRIGGRIQSVKFGDAYVDLGADWCHGDGDDIIVYKLAKKYNVLKEVDFDNSTSTYSGDNIDDDVHVDILTAIEEFYNSTDAYNTKFRNLSAKDYFMQKYNPILEKYKNDPVKFQQAKEGIFYASSSVESYESAFDWSDVSFFSHYINPIENKFFHWNGLGYHTILNILMEKYPDPKKGIAIDDKFILSKEVKSIHWKNDNNKVKIECSDGSNFEADHVIFTPSIGVLKNHHQTLFNPKLEEDKVEAFHKIGFGGVVKVVLHFQNPWWDFSETDHFILWSDKDHEKLLSEFPNAPHKDNKSWLSYIHYLTPASNNPKVLVVYIAGSLVPEIETMKHEELLKGILYALRKVYGKKYNITDPDAMIHSKWWNNPHFHGTWSYETVEANNLEKDFFEILAKPLEKDGKVVVQFAGEATYKIKFSTVNAAIESGFREANRLLKLYNKNIVE